MGQNGDQNEQQNWLLRQWSRLRGAPWRDVTIGQVGAGATNVIIGKNNIQINVGGRNISLPIWLITLALFVIIGFLAYQPLIEPWLFPSKMNATFNIAVAEFGALDKDGRVRSLPFGATLSKAVYDKLMTEYQENYPELMGRKDGVLIWEDSLGRAVKNVRFGVIDGATPAARAEQAKRLAQRINANLVIYGYLQQNSTGADELSLEFYVAGETVRGEPDAISGRHLLGQNVAVPIDATQEAMSAALWLSDGPLAARSQLLFWLTLGLTYETLNKPDVALELFQKAKDLLKLDDADGAGLLEYFIGREAFWLRRYDVAQAALERAQELDPTYANTWITLGNLYYDRAQLFYLPKPLPPALTQCVSPEQLANAAPSAVAAAEDTEQAISNLRQALQMAGRSPWPPIAAVGHLSLGNVYRLKGQGFLLAQPRDLKGAEEWFAAARQEFESALPVFSENEQTRYVAWTHLGLATTDFLQAYVPLQQIAANEDPATANLKKQASIQLFQSAAAEAQTCIDLSKDVGDLAYRQKVLDCGCVYYQQHAGELAAQVQATIKEFKMMRTKYLLWTAAVWVGLLGWLVLGSSGARAQSDQPQPLPPGVPVTGNVTNRNGEEWALVGCAGDVVTATMESTAFAPNLELYPPVGRTPVAATQNTSSALGATRRRDAAGKRGVSPRRAGQPCRDRGAYSLTLEIAGLAPPPDDLRLLTPGVAESGAVSSRFGEEWGFRGCEQDTITSDGGKQRVFAADGTVRSDRP